LSAGGRLLEECVLSTQIKISVYLGSVILIKTNNVVLSKFLCYILKSPIANQKMISISGATAQQAIYLRDIKNIMIPLPSLQEQETNNRRNR
jgi:type I restriction enzyme S subunit